MTSRESSARSLTMARTSGNAAFACSGVNSLRPSKGFPLIGTASLKMQSRWTAQPFLLIGSAVDRFADDLRIGDCRGVERGPSPADLYRQSREIDDASVATVAAQVVRSSHEDAIHRAGIDT